MTDLLERIAVCKEKWGMAELVEALTGEPVPANHKVPSMFNSADETPSMHIYDDSFYCYSTGKYGDVIDLVREAKRCTVERAVQILEDEADELGLVAVARTAAPKPVFVMPFLSFWRCTPDGAPPTVLPGIGIDVMRNLFNHDRVAQHGESLAIIHYDPTSVDYMSARKHEAVGIKYRHGDGKKTSEPGSDFSSFLYQPFEYKPVLKITGYPTMCVITEGETDSWAWLSVRPDDHVYALPSGAQSWKDKFLDQLTGYDKVYIAMDHDTAGVAARDKITRAVGWERAEHVQFPTNYKDIREAVASGFIPTLKQSTAE